MYSYEYRIKVKDNDRYVILLPEESSDSNKHVGVYLSNFDDADVFDSVEDCKEIISSDDFFTHCSWSIPQDLRRDGEKRLHYFVVEERYIEIEEIPLTE